MTVISDEPLDPPLTPPTAKPKPVIYERHGQRWEDEFSWLRDPDYPNVSNPAVLEYLHAENQYFERVDEGDAAGSQYQLFTLDSQSEKMCEISPPSPLVTSSSAKPSTSPVIRKL